MTSGSSVDSCPEDDQDSPFLKEFQLAAKQLEVRDIFETRVARYRIVNNLFQDLALTAADESKSIASDEYITDQPIVSVETIFVGWTECPRAELREDPQKALEVSFTKTSFLEYILGFYKRDSKWIERFCWVVELFK